MNEGSPDAERVSLLTIAREWTRLGCIGFGGPPAHIALLRRMCVDERRWMDERTFEDGVSTTNLLPGPASTQLAIYCAWRVRGVRGALIGGVCFVLPGLILILGLAAVFLAHRPPQWILGAAAGAGAAVPAVALNAARTLVPASRRRSSADTGAQMRWGTYAVLGAVAGATIGSYLVLVLITCGLVEIAVHRRREIGSTPFSSLFISPAVHVGAAGGLGALIWVAAKVGALSYGGGFVIVPLMQHDVVNTYHWMTGAQFLNAVALGQVTPGPVVQTVAVVGYAAGGIGGGLLAALIVFTPSFVFVLAGASRFDRIRENQTTQAFLSGAGPAVIGAIAGSAIPLGLAFGHVWQIPVLAGALLWLLLFRRGVVSCLLIAGAVGIVLAVLAV